MYPPIHKINTNHVGDVSKRGKVAQLKSHQAQIHSIPRQNPRPSKNPSFSFNYKTTPIFSSRPVSNTNPSRSLHHHSYHNEVQPKGLLLPPEEPQGPLLGAILRASYPHERTTFH